MKTSAHFAAVQQYVGYRGIADLSSGPPGRFMGSRPSTTLAECVCAAVFQGFVFGSTGTAETAAEG
jgi:hypothetical protein